MPARATIRINRAAETARIKRAGDAGLTDVRDDIIDSINRYVPVGGGDVQNGGGGDLRRSAELHSDQEAHDGKLTIRWDTPYAQYQNKGLVMKGNPQTRTYGPEKLNYTDPMARSEWEKYAEQQHGEEWELAIQRATTHHL